MPLLDEAKKYLELRDTAGGLPVEHMTVPQARAAANALKALQGAAEPVASVRDVVIPGPAGDIRTRLYAPALRPGLPVIVYFHGGGWVLGDLDLVDTPCRNLANATGALVASVDYRLAPEHRYPAAFEDARASLAWIARHAEDFGGDPARLIVAGDSAGGNLAAALCLDAGRNPAVAIAGQILIYPVTDFSFTTRSYRDYAEGYALGRASMQWFWAHYLGDQDLAPNALARPLRAGSHAGLPPAFVGVAEFDPLRDEGLAYAAALRDAGVRTIEREYMGLMHGFFWTLGLMPSGSALLRDIAAAMSMFRPVDRR